MIAYTDALLLISSLLNISFFWRQGNIKKKKIICRLFSACNSWLYDPMWFFVFIYALNTVCFQQIFFHKQEQLCMFGWIVGLFCLICVSERDYVDNQKR